MKNAALVFIIAGIATPCSADIYKCVSARGAVDYRDSPCEADAKAEKFVLQDEGPAGTDSANRETMARINGALEIYQKTREETREEIAANKAALPERPPQPADPEQSAVIAYPVTGYYGGYGGYGGFPNHSHDGHTHHHDRGLGRPRPNQVDKDPNWVLQMPDTSYRARHRAYVPVGIRGNHASGAPEDEKTGETRP